MKVLLLLATALPFISCQPLIGGQQPYKAELTDTEVAFAVNGINEFYKTNGDARPRTAEKILYATSQVVSGVIYRFEIELSGGDAKEVCNVSVWSRPWLNGDDAIRLEGAPKCVDEQVVAAASRQLGGQQVIAQSDPKVQALFQLLESSINAKSNSLYYLKAKTAAKVTEQVVNGIIYRITDLSFVPSSCTQDEVKQGINKVCSFSDSTAALEECSYEIYWNPRETPEYKINSELCKA